MTKRVRIAFLLSAMIITSCSGINNSVNTTVNPPAVSLTDKQYAGLEKEYSAFKTKSASQAYIKKKLDLFLDTANNGASIKGDKLLREVEFARIKGETEIPLKALFAAYPVATLYNKVATNSVITTAISQGNVPLGTFLNYTVNPLTLPGIILNLDAGNAASYPSPFNGTAWNDISASVANAILVNGPVFNSANQGSIVLDGNDDYVKSANLTVGTNFAMSVWINPGGFSMATVLSSLHYYADTYNGNFILRLTSPTLIDFASYNGRNNTEYNGVTVPAMSINTWYNITVTCDGSNLAIYLNGVNKGGFPHVKALTDLANGGLIIGRDLSHTNSPYIGKVAEVKIFNRNLSASEVLTNFNALKSRFGL